MSRATVLNLSLGILSTFFRTPLLPGCNVSKSCVMEQVASMKLLRIKVLDLMLGIQ